MKQAFSFGGMNIAVRPKHLTPQIKEALLSGRYENAERTAINMHVMAQDRVLDLGGGIGCTGIVAGKIVGGQNLMIVEANGDLVPEITENLAQNGIVGKQLQHAAIVAEADATHIWFHKPKGFWAGSLHAGNAPHSQKIKVPAIGLTTVVSAFRPSVIICDTEGIETEIFQNNLPAHVRLIILEFHPNLYEQTAIKALFDHLSKMGFSYLTRGSRGAVVCFGRKKTPVT